MGQRERKSTRSSLSVESAVRRSTMKYAVAWLVISAPAIVVCTVLVPPFFNIAENRPISASSTCGIGAPGPELFCKAVTDLASSDHSDPNSSQMECDYCDPYLPEQSYPPENMVDGTSSWWQSPPLSRGLQYNDVNITIDFGQEFQTAYFLIVLGDSQKPGIWTLEKSTDYGKTFSPWQYFAETKSDCMWYFGVESMKRLMLDNSVICETDYATNSPESGDMFIVSLLNNRPSASDFNTSPDLQEWSRATNVRIRFSGTRKVLGELTARSRHESGILRNYYYAIKDISIGGRCICNGHSDNCNVTSKPGRWSPYNQQGVTPPGKYVCQCQHHTCGDNCEFCCPGFQQKPWRPATQNDTAECEPCNCFGHSEECIYDPTVGRLRLSLDIHGKLDGGGVCQNCRDNTEGVNCNKCKSGFYRPHGKQWSDKDVCEPCECDMFYATGKCEEETGSCECTKGYAPPKCDRCISNYCGYPECRPCGSNGTATQDPSSDDDDEVSCPGNYDNNTACTSCAHGFYNYPLCLNCNCDLNGTVKEICDKYTGKCLCKDGYAGDKCMELTPTTEPPSTDPNAVNVTALRNTIVSNMNARLAASIKRLGEEMGETLNMCLSKIGELNNLLIAHKELVMEQNALILKQQAELVKLKRQYYNSMEK